ncbi:MAG: hypothetical protein P8Z36_08465 [Gemmatimonadota bacterium]
MAELGAQSQSVTITRGGVPVTDGRVLVNGVAIPHTGAGVYQGQLAAPVPAGSPLNLQVSAGGATVQGTGSVPETPGTGAAVQTGNSITVSWSSATIPDRFVVSLVSDDTAAKTFTAAGSAREIRIAASEFPAGAGLPIKVLACNNGAFSGRAHPDSRIGICAASPPIVITVSTPPPSRGESRVLVAADLGTQFQNVTITREGVPVTDHRVMVNGVAILHTEGGQYQGQLPGAVGAGSPIELVLGGDGRIIYSVGTGTMPEAPVLTAPATGATFDAGDSITVTWTSATDPDRFVVAWIVDGATFETHTAVGGTREIRIAASEFPAGADLSISVVACNEGAFDGRVDPASRMGICAPGPLNTAITTTPSASWAVWERSPRTSGSIRVAGISTTASATRWSP